MAKNFLSRFLGSLWDSLDTKDIILKYLVVIGSGLLAFYFDELEIVNPALNTFFIISISVFKTGFFIQQSLRKIGEVVNKNVAYFRFLIFMTTNILIIIISFSIDYFCLYQVDHSHFDGLPVSADHFRLLFEFVYLSMLGFNNLGFYDVVPVSIASKSLIMMEILLYYFSIILILSDFISLRDSIIEERIRKQSGEGQQKIES